MVKYLVNFTRDYYKQLSLQSQCNQDTMVGGRTLPNIDSATAIVTVGNAGTSGTVNTTGGSPTKAYYSQVMERKGSAEFNEQFVPTLVVRPRIPNMSTYELLQL